MQLFVSNVITASTQVIILFLIAMIGFATHKLGIYTESTSRKTTDLLFYIVTPAVIMRSFSGMEFNRDAIKGLLLALMGGILLHIIPIILSKFIFSKSTDSKACIFRYGSIYGNVGYMALPLVEAVLGAEGVFYCSVVVVPFNVLCFTHGVKLMQKESENKFNLKKLVLNPGTLGVIFGLPLFLLQIKLPEIVFSPISYIADLNTPLAMVMFGTYLASADWKTIFADKRIFITALIKIVLVPIITLAILRGVGITGTLLVAIVLSASAPTASNTVMFSAKYDRDTALASKVTSFVSVLSILTMPVMIAVAQSI